METNQDSEAEVRHLFDAYIEAIRTHDLDTLLSLYAPDLVAFDIVPPLQYVGAGAFGKIWQEIFDTFEKPIPYQCRDLRIVAGEDVAFSHSLNHNGGTMRNGRTADLWVRSTICYRRIDGAWRIAHLQASIPADMRTGRAVIDATPQDALPGT